MPTVHHLRMIKVVSFNRVCHLGLRSTSLCTIEAQMLEPGLFPAEELIKNVKYSNNFKLLYIAHFQVSDHLQIQVLIKLLP